jgi:hypothetical protein
LWLAKKHQKGDARAAETLKLRSRSEEQKFLKDFA